MGTKYSSVTVSGYNSSPPADDGSTSASNQITWDRIKTKLPDPLNTAIAAINSGLTTAFDYSARSITTSDSAIASDHMKTIEVASTVSSNVTVTLSDAASMAAGYCVGICNRSNFTATVTRATTSDVIDNTAAAVALMPQTSVGYKVNASTNGYLTMYRGTITTASSSGGGLVKIGTQTAAAAAQVDFTSAGYPTAFDGTYNEILFTFTDVQPSSAGSNLWIRYSNDGGSTFKAGATDYKYAGFYLGDVGGTLTIASASAGQIVLATAVNSPITEAVDGELRLFNPASTTNKKRVLWHTGYADNVTDNTRTHHGEGHMSLNTSAVTAIRFMFSSGNISGTIACYGVQK